MDIYSIEREAFIKREVFDFEEKESGTVYDFLPDPKTRE